jgi:TP901-1 family phage major tail protein
MSAQKAKDLLIKIEDAGTFVTVLGLRSKHLRFNTETVDVTHAESVGRWRELLAGAGVKKCSLTGNGVFKDEVSDALMRQTFFDGILRTLQIIIPDFGTLQGLFQITSLEMNGQHNAELATEMAFESAGALTFTAL